jgi:pilus assembly protein TadC
MDRLLENIYRLITFVVTIVVAIIELPIKVFLTLLFLVVFTILAFFAPFINKWMAPKWWDNWYDYIKNPFKFKSVRWVLRKY